jgi:hypothetical protein
MVGLRMNMPEAPAGRTAHEVCNLSRPQLRQMGLNSRKVLKMFDEARDFAAAEGCECGVIRIEPKLKRDRKGYSVDVYHAPTCPAHTLAKMRREQNRWRLRRVLRARRDSLLVRLRFWRPRRSRERGGASQAEEARERPVGRSPRR